MAVPVLTANRNPAQRPWTERAERRNWRATHAEVGRTALTARPVRRATAQPTWASFPLPATKVQRAATARHPVAPAKAAAGVAARRSAQRWASQAPAGAAAVPEGAAASLEKE